MKRVQRRKQGTPARRRHQLYGYRSTAGFDRPAPAFGQHAMQTFQCKKAQVRFIEDSPLAILEPAQKEPDSDHEISDVGYGNDDLPIVFEARQGSSEHRRRVAQMFQNVGEQDEVELSLVGKFKRFDIGGVKLVVMDARSRGPAGILLHADNLVAALLENRPQIPVCCANVQYF